MVDRLLMTDDVSELWDAFEPLGEPCPGCGARNHPSGVLGRLAHYLCRQCGLWYTR